MVNSSQGLNFRIVVLVKGGERYIFLYEKPEAAEILRIADRYAADPELTFTAYDAALLRQEVARHDIEGALR